MWILQFVLIFWNNYDIIILLLYNIEWKRWIFLPFLSFFEDKWHSIKMNFDYRNIWYHNNDKTYV